MKPIEELGISPTPWKVGDRIPFGEDYIVFCNYTRADGTQGRKIVAECNFNFNVAAKDARLIATAPKMYEKAYGVLNNLLIHLQWPEETIRMNRSEVAAMAKELQDALAEASGEVSNG